MKDDRRQDGEAQKRVEEVCRAMISHFITLNLDVHGRDRP